MKSKTSPLTWRAASCFSKMRHEDCAESRSLSAATACCCCVRTSASSSRIRHSRASACRPRAPGVARTCHFSGEGRRHLPNTRRLRHKQCLPRTMPTTNKTWLERRTAHH